LGLSAEFAESLGKEGLNVVLPNAQVDRLSDELLHGRTQLLAAGVNLQHGRLERDVCPDSTSCLNEVLPFEVLIDLGDREGIYVELSGEFADGGQLQAMAELSRQDALPHLLLKLHVKRHPTIGAKEKHGVLLL
jgi:hypothetical protein